MSDIASLNDALIECVKAAGGSKVVGPKLFPEKAVDAAQRQLLACLNDDRPDKLSPDQALLVMRMAKAKGCHIGIEFICTSLSYSQPLPIEPRDEVAQLQREFIEASAELSRKADRILALQAKITS